MFWSRTEGLRFTDAFHRDRKSCLDEKSVFRQESFSAEEVEVRTLFSSVDRWSRNVVLLGRGQVGGGPRDPRTTTLTGVPPQRPGVGRHRNDADVASLHLSQSESEPSVAGPERGSQRTNRVEERRVLRREDPDCRKGVGIRSTGPTLLSDSNVIDTAPRVGQEPLSLVPDRRP